MPQQRKPGPSDQFNNKTTFVSITKLKIGDPLEEAVK